MQGQIRWALGEGGLPLDHEASVPLSQASVPLLSFPLTQSPRTFVFGITLLHQQGLRVGWVGSFSAGLSSGIQLGFQKAPLDSSLQTQWGQGPGELLGPVPNPACLRGDGLNPAVTAPKGANSQILLRDISALPPGLPVSTASMRGDHLLGKSDAQGWGADRCSGGRNPCPSQSRGLPPHPYLCLAGLCSVLGALSAVGWAPHACHRQCCTVEETQ